jgi:hypothetical protein
MFIKLLSLLFLMTNLRRISLQARHFIMLYNALHIHDKSNNILSQAINCIEQVEEMLANSMSEEYRPRKLAK